MFGLRTVLSGVYRQIFDNKGKPALALSGDLEHMTQMAAALNHRQFSGQTTTLRQLHEICGIDQSKALVVLAQLRQAQIAFVEQNMVDEFESLVTIDWEASRRLADMMEPRQTQQVTD